METLVWVVGACLAMSLIAKTGLLTLALDEERLGKIILPLRHDVPPRNRRRQRHRPDRPSASNAGVSK